MLNYAKLIKEKTKIKPRTILEIGSRDGNDAEILRNFFNIPSNNVFVVEPNPNQVKKIKIKYPDIQMYTSAIYNKEGKMTFNCVNDSELVGISSLLNRVDSIYNNIDSEVIEVDVITGSQLLIKIEKEIDLCKIDVEGATFEVLESFGEYLTNIKSLHLENEHKEVWTNQKLYEDVREFLINSGYEEIFFEFVNGVPLQSDSIWVLKHLIK